jgi:predicted TIM-barrel fold metal-dependent hydrolase
LAERIAMSTTASGFADAFAAALQTCLDRGAVAWKSIVAYRHGLAVSADPPSATDVVAAAGRWLRAAEHGSPRVTDPTLLHFLIWSAVRTGRPIQVHTGFGDGDASLVASDPGLLQPFCAATQEAGTTIVLLHCYPYHREACWLAHLYPHVYVDIGLTLSYVGARVVAVLGEFLEVAPFGKVLYSSDAYGLPELYLVGAAQFRHAINAILGGIVRDGGMSVADAQRVAHAIGAENTRRVYVFPG